MCAFVGLVGAIGVSLKNLPTPYSRYTRSTARFLEDRQPKYPDNKQDWLIYSNDDWRDLIQTHARPYKLPFV